MKTSNKQHLMEAFVDQEKTQVYTLKMTQHIMSSQIVCALEFEGHL